MRKDKIKIGKLAKLIGILLTAFPAVVYGCLYYKELKSSKIRALNTYNNGMRKFTFLNNQAVIESQ